MAQWTTLRRTGALCIYKVFGDGKATPMPEQQEADYKKVLTEYHRSLMDIYRELKKAKNDQPGQKDQAATKAGMDFSTVVAEFHRNHGRLL